MALFLAILLWLITLSAVALFSGKMGWFPPQISEHGSAIDQQFMITLVVVGVAFVLAQVALGVYVWRYRDRPSAKVIYTHGNAKLEVVLTLITLTVFVILGILGQKVWAQLHLQDPPADAMEVEVTAQQFAWNFRYPGADGKFGGTVPRLINDQINPVGIDPKDEAGKDDVVSVNRFAIPVNRPIKLTLKSKDVTHSLFVPALRFKQDAVPGLAIPTHFKALQTGEYEIACTELCGLQHYKMKGFLMVMAQEEFNAWLKERASY